MVVHCDLERNYNIFWLKVACEGWSSLNGSFPRDDETDPERGKPLGNSMKQVKGEREIEEGGAC